MEIYLRQELIRPVRVQDLMYERRKYWLPQKKFKSIAKTKIADLKEKRKKLELKLTKARGQVIYYFVFKWCWLTQHCFIVCWYCQGNNG